MTSDMSGKTVVVTGAAGGVGAAVARRFAEAGATLVLGDLNAVALEDLCGQVAAVSEVHGVSCDVTSVTDIENLMAEAVQATGRIDVLVTTAGLWVEGPSEATTEAEWDRVIDVNLKGTFFACSRAIPELKKTQGCIIVLSSDCGLVGTPETAVYTASKGGVSLLTKALAIELAPHLVRVNAVCPADIMTPMLQYQADTYGGGDPEGYFKRLLTELLPGGEGTLHHAGGGRRADLLPRLSAGGADHRRQHLDRLRHFGRLRLRLMHAEGRSALRAVEPPPARRAPRRTTRAALVLFAVLVAASAIAGPAAAEYGPRDDWRHVDSVVAGLNHAPPSGPVVLLLGGSAARESITTEPAWRRQIAALGGGRVSAFNLGASSQGYRDDIEIVNALPAVPTILLIGVNLGRYTTIPPETVASTRGTRGAVYDSHRFHDGQQLEDSAKRALVARWLREKYPRFTARYEGNARVLRRADRSLSGAGLLPGPGRAPDQSAHRPPRARCAARPVSRRMSRGGPGGRHPL